MRFISLWNDRCLFMYWNVIMSLYYVLSISFDPVSCLSGSLHLLASRLLLPCADRCLLPRTAATYPLTPCGIYDFLADVNSGFCDFAAAERKEPPE
jgi:hypothetical protein